MEKRECFGSLQEITDKNGFTTTQSRPECRDCQELRECLRTSKQAAEEREERDELKKQNIITQIIDLSQIISNELGECLLEFLNRIYNSNMGTAFFKNLLLFLEVPQDGLSSTVTVPITPATLDLMQEEVKGSRNIDPKETIEKEDSKGFILRVILIQRHFPRNKKANMGLIAYAVARLFSSEDDGIRQILLGLSSSESNRFIKMDARQRIDWLVEKWGFRHEFDTFREEIKTLKPLG